MSFINLLMAILVDIIGHLLSCVFVLHKVGKLALDLQLLAEQGGNCILALLQQSCTASVMYTDAEWDFKCHRGYWTLFSHWKGQAYDKCYGGCSIEQYHYF
jgi:hypothetical protein